MEDDKEPTVRTYAVSICDACVEGEGEECHTAGCALFLHSVDLPIHKELLDELTCDGNHENGATLYVGESLAAMEYRCNRGKTEKEST